MLFAKCLPYASDTYHVRRVLVFRGSQDFSLFLCHFLCHFKRISVNNSSLINGVVVSKAFLNIENDGRCQLDVLLQ